MVPQLPPLTSGLPQKFLPGVSHTFSFRKALPRAEQSQGDPREELYLQLLHGQLLAVLLPALDQDVQGVGVVLALRVLQLLLDGFFQPLLQRLPRPDSLWSGKRSDHTTSSTLPIPGAADVLRTGPSHKSRGSERGVKMLGVSPGQEE